jgi:hypothetical protein
MTAEERFWTNIEKNRDNDCWRWTGALRIRDYGSYYYNGRNQLAHRVSWQINFGPIPDGIHVLHTCDNPSCVNPEHLRLGTHQDNMADRDAKGRQYDRNGEKNGRAKLTSEDVNNIRMQYSSGSITRKSLADKFNVNIGTIGRALSGRTWRQ